MAYDAEPALRLHNKLLYTTIALDYLGPTVEDGYAEKRFRAACRNHISDASCKSANSTTDLIDLLVREDKIGIGDYDVLRDILSFYHTVVDLIDDTEIVLRAKGITIYERIRGIKRVKGNNANNCKYVRTMIWLFRENPIQYGCFC